MNKLITTPTDNNTDVKKPEPVALLDCGAATKVTKGIPFLVLYEVCPPPFDRTLV